MHPFLNDRFSGMWMCKSGWLSSRKRWAVVTVLALGACGTTRLPYVLLVPINLISSLSKLMSTSALIVSVPVKRSNDVNVRLSSISRSSSSGVAGDSVSELNQDNMLAIVWDINLKVFVIERCLTHSLFTDHHLLHSSHTVHIHMPPLACHIPS